MRSDACAMASLVEAKRDGRLGDREAGSLARHLGTCAACRELDRELDEVRDLLRRPSVPSLTPLEHQRSRLALLRAAASPPPPRSSPRRPRLRAMVVVVAAVSVALAAWLRPRPAAVAVARHMPPQTPAALHDPVRLAEGERRGPYPAETTIRGSAEARFERHVEDRVERVELTEGTLDLAVRKLSPDERFLVATGDAEVEVRGTELEVEAHAGRIVRVAVSEGKVEVRYRRRVSVVAAGSAWRPPLETASARRGSRSEASKAFGDAVDMLGRGDYAAARSRLDAFRAAHPADERADLAAFLTIVSLQRAGRRSEAQEAARRYLELYPSGDRRADAARVAGAR